MSYIVYIFSILKMYNTDRRMLSFQIHSFKSGNPQNYMLNLYAENEQNVSDQANRVMIQRDQTLACKDMVAYVCYNLCVVS